MITPIAFGLTLLELIVVGMLTTILMAVGYCIHRYNQPPYRVVLGRYSSEGKWVLKYRSDFLFGEWESVFESDDKRLVQQKAREALFAHYRFRDFVNERDGESIIGDVVQDSSVSHKIVHQENENGGTASSNAQL